MSGNFRSSQKRLTGTIDCTRLEWIIELILFLQRWALFRKLSISIKSSKRIRFKFYESLSLSFVSHSKWKEASFTIGLNPFINTLVMFFSFKFQNKEILAIKDFNNNNNKKKEKDWLAVGNNFFTKPEIAMINYSRGWIRASLSANKMLVGLAPKKIPLIINYQTFISNYKNI